MMQRLFLVILWMIALPVLAQETAPSSPETMELVAPVAEPVEAAPAEPENAVPATPDTPAEAVSAAPAETPSTPAEMDDSTPDESADIEAMPDEAASSPAKPVTDAPSDDAAAPEADSKEAEAFMYDVAVLQGLNKVTARISEIEAPVGTSVRFGNLEIIVKRCWKSPPSEQPENAARVMIIDRRPDETPVEVFNGWMFSSSPSLSGLEHPVYDLVVLSCQKRKMGDNT